MSEGSVRAVCVSAEKGETKTEVSLATLVEDHGLEGDAHAGGWHRQISLLARSDVESMRERGLDLEPGDFGENMVVDGVDLKGLGIGSRIEVGEGLLEITQIGKACHNRCAIYFQTGDCIMPRDGVFARVVKGGRVRPDCSVRVVREVARSTFQVAVVTVSDSAAAGSAGDTSGPAVADLLVRRLHAHLAWTGVVPDEEERITSRLVELTDRGLDLVVSTGGTGCAARDRTPEATRAVIEREIPGLAEAMRAASANITPHAWLQRGVCGIRRSTVIVNLPGSRKAAIENLGVVLPVLPHAIQLLRGETAHSGSERERRGG